MNRRRRQFHVERNPLRDRGLSAGPKDPLRRLFARAGVPLRALRASVKRRVRVEKTYSWKHCQKEYHEPFTGPYRTKVRGRERTIPPITEMGNRRSRKCTIPALETRNFEIVNWTLGKP